MVPILKTVLEQYQLLLHSGCLEIASPKTLPEDYQFLNKSELELLLHKFVWKLVIKHSGDDCRPILLALSLHLEFRQYKQNPHFN